ncbi:phosphotransferase [Embleya sp. NPDC055664]
MVGRHTLAKAQHREHERLSSVLWFETLRTDLGLPAPELLDAGQVRTSSGPRWWIVMRRVRGEEVGEPNPSRLRALGTVLRSWHEQASHHGLRLDDPGGLGVLLGSFRTRHPDAYAEASALLADACMGRSMSAVHGDVAVGHNTLYDGDKLVALLDPGAVHVAPAMLDLAWCLAVDLPRGAHMSPLLEGYGHDGVDREALDALLPHLYLRRLVDVRAGRRRDEAAWLAERLQADAPHLLRLLGGDESQQR